MATRTTDDAPAPDTGVTPGRAHVRRTVRAHRARFVRAAAFQVVGAVAPLLQVLLLRAVVDDLVQGRTVGTQTAWQIGGMAGLGLVGVWAGFAARVAATAAAAGVVADLRTAMFRRLTTMPIHFYTTVRPGAVVSRLTNDVNGAEEMWTSVIPTVVSSLTAIVASLVIVAFVDPRLVLLLVVVPLAVAYVRRAEARINELIGRSFDVTKDLASTVETFVSRDGVVLARQNARTRQEQAAFEQKATELADLSAATARAGATSGATYGTAFVLITAGALGMGVWLVAAQGVTVGSVVLVVLYLQQLQGPVQNLLNTRYPRLRSTIALERVEAVLGAEQTVGRPTDPTTAADRSAARAADRTGASRRDDVRGDAVPAVRTRGLRYRYPSVASYSIEGLSHAGDALSISWLPLTGLVGDGAPADPARGGASSSALDGIDLTVHRGEVVAVVGASGAGKSTLAHVLAGLVEPDDGAVEVDGTPVHDLDEARRAELVAYIPQDPYVLHASVRDNLRYARPDATDDELLAVCASVALDDLVRRLDDGLDSVIGEKGHRLSGGERQRLAIARAALRRPALVVLDEPTAHLDTATEAQVRAAMSDLFAGAGVLMIAHRLSTVRDADRIVVLADGRVAQEGTHDELAATVGPYRRLLDAGAVARG